MKHVASGEANDHSRCVQWHVAPTWKEAQQEGTDAASRDSLSCDQLYFYCVNLSFQSSKERLWIPEMEK